MMKNLTFKFAVSAIALYSILFTAITAQAAPVRFNQVVQIIDAKPGKAGNGGFAKLRLADDNPVASDDTTKTDAPKPQQDDRVITETKAEIVENDVCDCVESSVIGGGFPYGWLALGGVPFLFLIPPGDSPNDSPSPTPSETPTPGTQTPTPTPPTEPVPEPMTILLFGTGLAGVGLAARRRFGKKDKNQPSAE